MNYWKSVNNKQYAKEAFSAVWGRDIDLSLQIPYHPRLALTEEPYVFKRKRGYLIEAYRAIEARMLGALGHDGKRMAAKIRDRLKEEDYVDAMHMLTLRFSASGRPKSANTLPDPLVTSTPSMIRFSIA